MAARIAGVGIGGGEGWVGEGDGDLSRTGNVHGHTYHITVVFVWLAPIEDALGLTQGLATRHHHHLLNLHHLTR